MLVAKKKVVSKFSKPKVSMWSKIKQPTTNTNVKLTSCVASSLGIYDSNVRSAIRRILVTH